MAVLTTESHRTRYSIAAVHKNVEVVLKKKLSKNTNETQGGMKSRQEKMNYVEPWFQVIWIF